MSAVLKGNGKLLTVDHSKHAPKPSTPKRPLIVVIPTHPPRRAACEELLKTLAAQDMQPYETHLVLDGYGPNDMVPASPLKLHVKAFENTGGRGSSCRYFHVEKNVPRNALVLFLDDDLLIPSDTIRFLMRFLTADDRTVVSWAFSDTCPVGNWAAVSSGTLLTPAAVVQDFVKEPALATLMRKDESDDVVFSAWLWKHKYNMHRARGKTRIGWHADAHGHARLSMAGRVRRVWMLGELWGWPGGEVIYGGERPQRRVDLLLATVPWRKKSCERLLREIAAQTVVPEVVHLLLDGYTVDDDHPRIPPGLVVRTKVFNPARGAGNRWRYVAQLAEPAAIIVNLDDDARVPKDFVARMAAEVERTGGAVCCSGYPVDGGFAGLPVAGGGPVICVQTGFFAVPSERIRCIDRFPLADSYLGMLGDDEAFVSAYLWCHGVQMRRMWIPNLGFDPSYKDARSQFNRKGGLVRIAHSSRTTLVEKFGWPMSGIPT